MTNLITDEQRVQLLANGRQSLEQENFDPAPVVKLFTPDAGATWLLTEIDPEDHDHAFACATWVWAFPNWVGSAWSKSPVCVDGSGCQSNATCTSGPRSG